MSPENYAEDWDPEKTYDAGETIRDDIPVYTGLCRVMLDMAYRTPNWMRRLHIDYLFRKIGSRLWDGQTTPVICHLRGRAVNRDGAGDWVEISDSTVSEHSTEETVMRDAPL